MNAKVVDIKRFAVHDGPGIRTTVFLKGCSLSCRWCHNPESISFNTEIGFFAKKCIGCGMCREVCPVGAHQFENGKHIFDRTLCTACGKCVEACFYDALSLYGKNMTVEEVFQLVMEDRNFYSYSGGGVTISGGEPLLQADFCTELFRALQAENIHTAIDTSGSVGWKAIASVLPYTKLFLYDLKQMDETLHKTYTGQSNERILENLRRLSEVGASIEIRIPLIPRFNDDKENVDAIGRFLNGLSGIVLVRVLPYHSLARSKYESIGKCDTMPYVPSPDDEKLEQVVSQLKAYGLNALSGKE